MQNRTGNTRTIRSHDKNNVPVNESMCFISPSGKKESDMIKKS